MGARPGSGDQQDVRCEVKQPGKRDLSRCRRQVAGHFIAPTMLTEMPASRGAYVTALCSQ